MFAQYFYGNYVYNNLINETLVATFQRSNFRANLLSHNSYKIYKLIPTAIPCIPTELLPKNTSILAFNLSREAGLYD